MILQISLGLILAIIGVLIIKYGDRNVKMSNTEGGIILKLFSQSYLNPKLLKWQNVIMKWVIGLAAIWFGIWLVFDLK